MTSQPLEGTPGLQIHFGTGREAPQPSQPQGPIIVDLEAKQKKPDHTSDADDEHFMKGPVMPPGLLGGGPSDDDDEDDDGWRGRKEKKDKKKNRKPSRGRSRRRRRRDPSSSPSSSSPTTSSSDSESSFARKVRKALDFRTF